jgi:hypothetical protein
MSFFVLLAIFLFFMLILSEGLKITEEGQGLGSNQISLLT